MEGPKLDQMNLIRRQRKTYGAILCNYCRSNKCFICSKPLNFSGKDARICQCCVSSKKLKCTKCGASNLIAGYQNAKICQDCFVSKGNLCAKCKIPVR